jgi:hypothetical protein
MLTGAGVVTYSNCSNCFDSVLSCVCIMHRMHTAYICKRVFGNHVPVRCVEHAVVEASDALRKRLHHCCFVFWVNDVAKGFWSVDRLPVGDSNVEPVASRSNHVELRLQTGRECKPEGCYLQFEHAKVSPEPLRVLV